MFFHGDVIVIPLMISIPLFIWQFWLCRKRPGSSFIFLPLAIPGVTLIFALMILMYGESAGFLDLSDAIAALFGGIGLCFLLVIGLAWLISWLMDRRK